MKGKKSGILGAILKMIEDLQGKKKSIYLITWQKKSTYLECYFEMWCKHYHKWEHV